MQTAQQISEQQNSLLRRSVHQVIHTISVNRRTLSPPETTGHRRPFYAPVSPRPSKAGPNWQCQ